MRHEKIGFELPMADSKDHLLAAGKEKVSPYDSLADLDDLRKNSRQATNLLKALAHEPRLMILCVLTKGERSVTELETVLGMRQPAVSQQLARLRMDGIVLPRRQGKAIYYSLANDDVRRIMTVLCDIFYKRK